MEHGVMGFTADDLVPIGVLFAVVVAVLAVEIWWRSRG